MFQSSGRFAVALPGAHLGELAWMQLNRRFRFR
jgi:hypothetical protein